jgi:hypothetical protein
VGGEEDGESWRSFLWKGVGRCGVNFLWVFCGFSF